VSGKTNWRVTSRLLIFTCLRYGSIHLPCAKNVRVRADSFSTHKDPTSPTYLRKKRLFQLRPNIENVFSVLLSKHRTVLLWSTDRCPVRINCAGTSSFQGKAKNLKWLFYACQIIFKSFTVLRRGRSLPKEEAFSWGWLSPTLSLQTESFERQTEFTAFQFARIDY
jgi:hypothetical protein